MPRAFPIPVLRAVAAPPPQHSFIVGQDHQGRWVAVEIHGLGGGLFRSCRDAIHYAAGETPCRPDAVPLSAERIEFRLGSGAEKPGAEKQGGQKQGGQKPGGQKAGGPARDGITGAGRVPAPPEPASGIRRPSR
ncbi:hypothetical protein [Methylobacterium sp. 77]|uniref:hypothetical protein n=1 Tax=Methylobacterium sp. 77 TaxID=1101192 RepID=UPI0032AE8DA0